MAEPRFRSGLFTRLFVLCGSVALLSAAIATLAFHSYRTTLTNDRLAIELTAQAHAIAPLAGARLAAGDAAGASRLLRSFSATMTIPNEGFSPSSGPGCGPSTP